MGGESDPTGVGGTGVQTNMTGRLSPRGGMVRKMVREKERQEFSCKGDRSGYRAGNCRTPTQDRSTDE